MNLNYKLIAVAIVVVSALVAGAYTLGVNQSQRQAVRTAAAGMPGGEKAGPLKPGAKLPPNHPSIPGARTAGMPTGMENYVRYRVGRLNIKGIYADKKYVWVGTSGGLIRFDTATSDYKVFDNKTPGILSNGVFYLNKVDGKLLLGTYGGGLSVMDLKTSKWHNYNIPDGLADQFVYDVAKARNGDVWIATWSGANRVRGGRFDDPDAWDLFTVENTHHGLPNPWVYSVKEGPDGAMWFATEMGLARYKDGKWDHWNHDDGLGAPFAKVKDTIEFTNDPAKVSSHHLEQKKEAGLGGINVAYNPNYIISLQVDEKGYVWAGTWGAGLARFDGKHWRNFTTADGLPANHIFMLYQDPKGRLWIGTDHGLARLNPDGETFTVMTSSDGLFADNVFSMDFAADGSMWVGSFGGLSHITAKM